MIHFWSLAWCRRRMGIWSPANGRSTLGGTTHQPGSGKRLLPLGWTAENYGGQQIGPEQLLGREKTALFSRRTLWMPVNSNTAKVGVSLVGIARLQFRTPDVQTSIYAIFQRFFWVVLLKLSSTLSPEGQARVVARWSYACFHLSSPAKGWASFSFNVREIWCIVK